MNEQVKAYIDKYPNEITDMYNDLRQAVIWHKEELAGYKITPKGMVQIYLKQDIPYEILKQVFAETLEG